MAGSAPTFAQRRLARALRRLRTSAGLTIDQVADKIDLSASTISRLETAQASAVRRGDVRELLEIYGVTGTQLDELLQLAGQSRRRRWWQEFRDLPNVATLDLEAEAAIIRQFSAQLVPGILQTEQYALEVLRSIPNDDESESRERLLKLRMNRQRLLSEQKKPQYEIVLDEGVVRRVVGDPKVMQAQLERLIVASELPNITLQLLPFSSGAHAAMDGEFTIFRYQHSEDTEAVYDDPDVVYLENLGGGAFIEDRNMTTKYNRAFEQLRTKAVDPVKSVQILAEIEGGSRDQERR